MRRQRTVAIDKNEVDFAVLEFSCRDSSSLSHLGAHCKETAWRIAAGLDSRPIDVQLVVGKQVGHSPEVTVVWDGRQVFPSTPGSNRSKLKEDFVWRVPFRGTIKGINQKDYFEIRPEHMGADHWFTATLLRQREDGLFEAQATMPDGRGGVKMINYPVVRPDNIREAGGMKMPVSVPSRTLVLQVPKASPLRAVLSVDGTELITHFFARPTPPPVKAGGEAGKLVKPGIFFKVSRDRTKVVADVGHTVLTHFLAGDVRALRRYSTGKLKHAWVIQIGPFAEHIIEIEKKYKNIPIPRREDVVTVTVDGELLVESSAEDIESRDDVWECAFRFVGEKLLEWEVFETDPDGLTLSSKGIVRQATKYMHECVISLSSMERDLSAAQISIDDVDFQALCLSTDGFRENMLECAPEALMGSYGLVVPYKVADAQRTGFGAFANAIRMGRSSGGDGGSNSFAAFFAACCSKSGVADSEITMDRDQY